MPSLRSDLLRPAGVSPEVVLACSCERLPAPHTACKKRLVIICSGGTAAPPNLRPDIGITGSTLLLAYSANILASVANTSSRVGSLIIPSLLTRRDLSTVRI